MNNKEKDELIEIMVNRINKEKDIQFWVGLVLIPFIAWIITEILY